MGRWLTLQKARGCPPAACCAALGPGPPECPGAAQHIGQGRWGCSTNGRSGLWLTLRDVMGLGETDEIG